MFKRGLVIGKFYPPHRGHKHLIDTASMQCEQLTVIMCSTKNEWIPGDMREKWLRHIHPKVDVRHMKDILLGDNDSSGWAKFTLEYLGYVPDAVFTSEDYGDPYAHHMGTVHVCVDKARAKVPISGTLVRSNPFKYLSYLEPCVRAHFVKHICVVGAESTGTTTLAKDLAKYYRTAWVPEFGRLYSEGKLHAGIEAQWRTEEFITIARAQNDLEEALTGSSNGVLICDTDAFATSVWHERYMGSRSTEVEKIAKHIHHDFYILRGDEIPFEQDGTRDGEHIRRWMHHRFEERLIEENKRFIVVRGDRDERLRKAAQEIEILLEGSSATGFGSVVEKKETARQLAER